MKDMELNEMSDVVGGQDGALTVFGAQLAADGLNHANSSNPVVAAAGLVIAAAGGWLWAFGSFGDGLAGLI